jgi:hypothetical protein
MRVATVCEYSGCVRDAFIRAGHDAISCDILPSESDLGPHYQGDALEFLRNEKFDLVIGFPPCTFLCNSGARWLWDEHGNKILARWEDLNKGADFFRAILETEAAPRIVVENPVQHSHATKLIGQSCTQSIQPWQFGEGEVKAICFWLRNVPKLHPTKYVEGREARVWKMGEGPNRQKERSRFFVGIADAMAAQWGNLGPVEIPEAPRVQMGMF